MLLWRIVSSALRHFCRPCCCNMSEGVGRCREIIMTHFAVPPLWSSLVLTNGQLVRQHSHNCYWQWLLLPESRPTCNCPSGKRLGNDCITSSLPWRLDVFLLGMLRSTRGLRLPWPATGPLSCDSPKLLWRLPRKLLGQLGVWGDCWGNCFRDCR